ncbi:MAG: hypothetical protein QM490_03645 [Candidatus Gracilibacteria bacterium]
MYEHTTTSIAEYLGCQRQNITRHIKAGNLKAEYKAILNTPPKYYISHKEYLRFCDWWLYDKSVNVGVSYKKTPTIDEYDLAPKKYNSYVALKIKRDKAILKCKYLSKQKYIQIALYFNLKTETIQQIVSKNKETNFAKSLIIQYEKSIIKIDEVKKNRKIPNVDEKENFIVGMINVLIVQISMQDIKILMSFCKVFNDGLLHKKYSFFFRRRESCS